MGTYVRAHLEEVHVLAPPMVDVSMIDCLLCFSVSQLAGPGAGRWTTGQSQQGRNESSVRAKDFQLQKESVIGFARVVAMLACCSELNHGFSDLFLLAQAVVNHSLKPCQVCHRSNYQ